jgi:transcriptional regulator with XRE-family HTH domain
MNDTQRSGYDFTWAEVGTRIRERRAASGMTQVELAAAAEMSQSGLQAIESGGTNPQLDTLRKIAFHLKLSLRELIVGAIAAPDGIDGETYRQIQRILCSGKREAIITLLNGIQSAGWLLDAMTGKDNNDDDAQRAYRERIMQELLQEQIGSLGSKRDDSNYVEARPRATIAKRKEFTSQIQKSNSEGEIKRPRTSSGRKKKQ